MRATVVGNPAMLADLTRFYKASKLGGRPFPGD
jgi:hypothetical protein